MSDTRFQTIGDRNKIRVALLGSPSISKATWGRRGIHAVRLRSTGPRNLFRETFHALVVDLDSTTDSEARMAARAGEWMGVPLVLIKSSAASGEVTELLHHGAEDVITGPVSDEFIAARVASIVRPLMGQQHYRRAGIWVGDSFVDLQRRVISSPRRASRTLLLPELLLFRALLSAQGGVVRYQDLAVALRNSSGTASVNSVRRWIKRLRETLEVDPTNPRSLLNVWGVGYRMVLTTEDGPAFVEQPVRLPQEVRQS